MKIIILILQIGFLALFLYISYNLITLYKLNNEFKDIGADDIKRKKIVFISSFIMCIFSLWVSLGVKMVFPNNIIIIAVFTFIPFLLDLEFDSFEKQQLGFIYADIFFIFEICFKSGLDLNDALFICSKFIKSKNIKRTFQRAGATYKKSKDKEETMQILSYEINTKEMAMLKSSVTQIERIGYEGIKTLETLTSIMETSKRTKQVKKKDLIQYMVLIASFLLLMGIFNLLFNPLMQDINGSMETLFK